MAGALLLAAHHQATLFVHLSGRGGDSEGGGVWPSRFSLWHIVRPISLWTWRACVVCVGGIPAGVSWASAHGNIRLLVDEIGIRGGWAMKDM